MMSGADRRDSGPARAFSKESLGLLADGSARVILDKEIRPNDLGIKDGSCEWGWE